MRGRKLFRGKTEDGMWLLGSLLERGEESFIVPKFDDEKGWIIIPVLPNTVSQLIDYRYDIDEQFLFEGDIIRFKDRHNVAWRNEIAVVVDESCIIIQGLGRCFPQDCYDYRKIGNIWDNSDLLDAKTLNWCHLYLEPRGR